MEYDNKKRKHFTISSETMDYIKDIKLNKKCKSESEAIELIVMEHKEKSDTTTELMIKIIASEVGKVLKGDIEKINKCMNSSDRNVQVMLEMINGLFIKNNVGEIITTDVFKSEGLEISQNAVKKRISKNRVRKLNNE